MEIVLKSALVPEQLKAREALNSNYRIELHLDDNTDLSTKWNIKNKLCNIHYYLKECDLSNILATYKSEKWTTVVAMAKEHNASIVIHNDMFCDDFKNHDEYENFISYLRKTEIHLCLENRSKTSNNCGGIFDIAPICELINSRVGRTCITPLIDTCHVLTDMHTMLNPGYSLEELIDLYAYQDTLYVHFANCIGDSSSKYKRHGTSFMDNMIIFNALMDKFTELENKGIHVILIIEQIENDYTNLINIKHTVDNINLYLERGNTNGRK